MINFIYVVHDKIAQESGPIFEAKNDGVAKRAYVSMMPKDINPADFRLFRLGTIDHTTNTIAYQEPPVDVLVNIDDEVEDEQGV